MLENSWSPARLAPIIGVSESTVKRWIDRGHLRAERTPGGHRRIALADVISFLRARGRALPSPLAIGARLGAARAVDAVTPEALARLLVDGDAQAARAILLGQYRAGRSIDDLLDHLAAPAMAHVGLGWAEGRISVHEEHAATLRLYGILLDLRSLIPGAAETALMALGGAPEGDPYLLPSLMVELTLADMGWRTINLGPHTPAWSLREAIEQHRPRLAWLSITSPHPAAAFLADYPHVLEAAQARRVSLIVGGQGLTAALQHRLVATAFGFRLAHLRAFVLGITG